MWLVRPIVQKEESMSSVLLRLSVGNNLSIENTCSILFGKDNKKDLDKLSPFRASLVGEAAELTEKQEQSLSCWQWDSKLVPDMSGRTNFDWFPSLPSRQDEALPLAYPRCIPCLQEDNLPYARITHRLGFVVCCPKHKVLLVQKCHACGQLLPFPNVEPFLCVSCGQDQRNAIVGAPNAFVETQNTLLDILEQGWLATNRYGAQYSFVFFRVLLYLCRLLTSKSWGKPLRQAVRNAGGPQSNIEEKTYWHRGDERIIRLSSLERAKLLSSALWLWEDWPARFVDACQKANIFSHTILSYGRNPPFILLDPVREALLKPFYAFSEEEVCSAKAYLHKQGKRASLTSLQALTGNKLHAWSNAGDAGRICVPYGLGRYWKLDGVSSQVKAQVKKEAITEGIKTAQWVERALEQALEKNSG